MMEYDVTLSPLHRTCFHCGRLPSFSFTFERELKKETEKDTGGSKEPQAPCSWIGGIYIGKMIILTKASLDSM